MCQDTEWWMPSSFFFTYPAVAKEPVLQWVSTRTGASPTTFCRMASAPCVPIALLSAMSLASIASVASRNLNAYIIGHKTLAILEFDFRFTLSSFLRALYYHRWTAHWPMQSVHRRPVSCSLPLVEPRRDNWVCLRFPGATIFYR